MADAERRRAGVDPADLDERQLLKELESVHRTRHETLLHGAPDALDAHNSRMAELEGEYLRRHPRRQVTPSRTREGARAREP
ncbi:DUF6158 family protein [Streptomyces sp. WAC 00631]|uniref:DUF6158 family protein n=1 Tax=Streptomyces TaxID=1883 RepID=UPI000F793F5E|nr:MULTISPECIES: DUF6158 family protein [Streptomyces]MCC3650970.1 DUF6158 family protein [Streptomyces sp. S07_1.15]MCC5036242.1 DUF6158 family protein [Streptomyces sp. WAC 00631]WSQ74191.1 DUF6158 family protein [Streptomyces xinghaiensis]